MSMQANFDHCSALVRAHDRDRYLATLFAPADLRDALYALYAFNHEIVRVHEAAREPMPGEIRLQWWREVLLGGRESEAAANPVAAALCETAGRYRLDRDRLIAETADLVYHLLVVLHARGIAFSEVEAALAERTRQSGLAEKMSRGRS